MRETYNYTVDFDEDACCWKCVKRDPFDNMPVDEWGYSTKKGAERAAANRRYAQKTKRPVVRVDV